MKYVNIVTLGYVLLFGDYCYAAVSSKWSHMNISSHYLNVEDQSCHPPPEDSLRIVCQKKTKSRWLEVQLHALATAYYQPNVAIPSQDANGENAATPDH